MGARDALRSSWKAERDIINRIVHPSAVVISCGWNSVGMGVKRGWTLVDGILVSHGAGHNDLIVIAERRTTALAEESER